VKKEKLLLKVKPQQKLSLLKRKKMITVA